MGTYTGDGKPRRSQRERLLQALEYSEKMVVNCGRDLAHERSEVKRLRAELDKLDAAEAGKKGSSE